MFVGRDQPPRGSFRQVSSQQFFLSQFMGAPGRQLRIKVVCRTRQFSLWGLAESSEALAKSNSEAYKGIVVQKATEARMDSTGLRTEHSLDHTRTRCVLLAEAQWRRHSEAKCQKREPLGSRFVESAIRPNC